ncbi:hypothetical protein IEQ34_021709 [Dendrobium chrysotoxum]|uniref:Replication factor A C-terminal domain-containing protein n=1 Tax=Dendrobium chrysotoxum TaxID=161865 RepID=A0AAV7G499_DENCH|nr:hypothetical protein IEQ34_021709 [Dendrobium chrysotoxum]
MDKEGSKIYAIMFNETISRFDNMFKARKTYKHFYNVKDKFEIILNNTLEIQLVADSNIRGDRI